MIALGLVFVLLGLLVRHVILESQRQRAQRLIARQFRESLRLIVHALQVGTGLQQALEVAAREGQKPLATEWERLLQSLHVGRTWDQGLKEFSDRVRIPAVPWFVAAVHVTRQTGGSLADVLLSLAETLQERETLREKVSALTAQGKASGCVLAALPFVLLGTLQMIVPDLMRPMFETNTGLRLLAGVLMSVSIGGYLIWAIVSIKEDI